MFTNLVPSILKGSKVIQSFVIKNSGPILTTVGVASLLASSVAMYKAAVKVKIEKEKAEEKIAVAPDEETIKQIKRGAAIKVAKIMLAPVLFAGICAFCIISNNYIHLKKQAGLAAAYALSEQTLKDYEDSLEPIVGKKKAEAVREEVAHKDVERNAPKTEDAVIDTGKGNTLFYEPKIGIWFRSNHDAVRNAFLSAHNSINDMKVRKEEVRMEKIYKDLNLPKSIQDSVYAQSYGFLEGQSVGCNLNQTGTSPWDEPYVYVNYHALNIDGDMTL